MTATGVDTISTRSERTPLQAADQIFDGKKVFLIFFPTFIDAEFDI